MRLLIIDKSTNSPKSKKRPKGREKKGIGYSTPSTREARDVPTNKLFFLTSYELILRPATLSSIRYLIPGRYLESASGVTILKILSWVFFWNFFLKHLQSRHFHRTGLASTEDDVMVRAHHGYCFPIGRKELPPPIPAFLLAGFLRPPLGDKEVPVLGFSLSERYTVVT